VNGTLFSGHLLSIATYALTLILVSTLIRSRRPPANTIAWLLIMGVAPYVGIPFFLIFGSRKITREGKKRLYLPAKKNTEAQPTRLRKVLRSAGAPDPTPNSKFEFLETGEEAYRGLLSDIRGAKESIDIATFIFSRDEVGQSILQELSQKAAEGVSVRLLVDAWGSSLFVRPSFKRLKASGGQVGFFMPLIHLPFKGKTNLRNHRKIAIFDKKRAWFGGMNFAKEYLGPTSYAKRWKDLSVGVEGESVSALLDIFESDWRFATGEKVEPRDYTANPSEKGVGEKAHVAQVVASGPDVPEDPLYQGLLESSFEAEERIWIATPYFIPDDSLIKGLELACRRGVDVRLLTPQKSNHFFADLSRGSYLRQLVEAGGKVYFYPEMIHAKMVIVDEEFSLIGSANFDMRSLLYNYELGVFTYSLAELRAASLWMESLFQKSRTDYFKPGQSVGLFRGLGEGIGRLFGPLL
jgi:cardiolipin synthase